MVISGSANAFCVIISHQYLVSHSVFKLVYWQIPVDTYFSLLYLSRQYFLSVTLSVHITELFHYNFHGFYSVMHSIHILGRLLYGICFESHFLTYFSLPGPCNYPVRIPIVCPQLHLSSVVSNEFDART